jgi:hypothetical protein
MIINMALGLLLLSSCEMKSTNQALYDEALENGKAAWEGYRCCRAFLEAWMEYADPVQAVLGDRGAKVLGLGRRLFNWMRKRKIMII